LRNGLLASFEDRAILRPVARRRTPLVRSSSAGAICWREHLAVVAVRIHPNWMEYDTLPGMPPHRERLTYRSSLPLASAPTIDVETNGGDPGARLERGRTEDGQVIWRWSGGEMLPFVVEDEGDLQSFLVTREDGAPFGRIRVRGLLRIRLEARDARAVQMVVQPDGRLCSPEGEELGAIDLRSPTEVVLELEPLSDPTRLTLALATPLCHAAASALMT
jgi:hypothetical protein